MKTDLETLLFEQHPHSEFGKSVYYFFKWSALAALAGVIGGFAGGLFSRCLSFVTVFRQGHDWLLYLMPLAGLLIVWSYQITGESKNRGTNMVLSSLSAKEEITPATGPLIFFSTALTHLVGGSAGREGAALQLGGSIGTVIGKLLHLNERNRKMMVLCGMSAVFAALFGTPVAAAVFCIEVVHVGTFRYAALLPCMLSAFLGRDIALFLGAEQELFSIAHIPAVSFQTLLPIIVVGLACALYSIVVCTVLHNAEHYYKKVLPNPYLRILAASAVFIVLTLVSGTRIYNGSSMILIEESIAGEVRWEAFLLKLLFTAAALGGGFRGGEIVPTLCMGSTLGVALGTLLGFEPSLMAACGMIALFAGVTNCPLSSILLALELFGGEGLPFFAVAVTVSFALSGYCSLYSAQTFAFSKRSMKSRSNG